MQHQLVELGYGASAHGGGTSVAFNLQPRPTGQLLIGSSRQFDNRERELICLLAQMLDRARHFVPALATLNIIRCWSGLRAASQDGNPLIGPHPARRGVWLALGHEGLGVTTAPATAELLAAQILDERSPLAPDARSRYVCVNRRRLHEGHSQHHRRWPASDGAGRISVAAALALTGDPTTRRG